MFEISESISKGTLKKLLKNLILACLAILAFGSTALLTSAQVATKRTAPTPRSTFLTAFSFRNFGVQTLTKKTLGFAHALPLVAHRVASFSDKAITSIPTDLGSGITFTDTVPELAFALPTLPSIDVALPSIKLASFSFTFAKTSKEDVVLPQTQQRDIGVVGTGLTLLGDISPSKYVPHLLTAKSFTNLSGEYAPHLTSITVPRVARIALVSPTVESKGMVLGVSTSQEALALKDKKSTLPFIDRLSLSLYCAFAPVDRTRCDYDAIAQGTTSTSSVAVSETKPVATTGTSTLDLLNTAAGKAAQAPVYITKYITQYVEVSGKDGKDGRDGKDGANGLASINNVQIPSGFGAYAIPSYTSPSTSIGISTIAYLKDTTIENPSISNGSAFNLFLDTPTLKNAALTGLSVFSGSQVFGGSTSIDNLTATGTIVINASTTNAYITSLTADNASTTNLFASSAIITNSTTTDAYIGHLTIGDQTAGNALFVNASTTNLFATSSYFIDTHTDSLTIGSTTSSSGGLSVNGTSTLASTTITSLMVDQATSTSLFASLLSAVTSFITNLTVVNGTSTNFFTQNLAVGNASTTGNQSIDGSFNVTGTSTLGSNVFLNGNVTIGTSSNEMLTVNSLVNSDIVPAANKMYDLGSPSFFWKNLYADNINVNSISAASTSIAGTNNSIFSINADNASTDGEDASLVFIRGLVTPNALLRWNSTAKRFETNQSLAVKNETPSTGTTTFTVQAGAGQGSTNLLELLNNGGSKLSAFNAQGWLGIGTSTPATSLHLATTDGLIIPVGTTLQRPSSTLPGIIRYNTTNSTFEGFNGGTWGTLGGVIDANQDTYVSAEDTPGSNNDQLKFFTFGTQRAIFDNSGNFGIGTSTPSSLVSIASSTATGNSSLFSVGTTTSLFNILANGNVGIGSSTPTSALVVNGSVTLGSNATLKFGGSGGTATIDGSQVLNINPTQSIGFLNTQNLTLTPTAFSLGRSNSQGFTIQQLDAQSDVNIAANLLTIKGAAAFATAVTNLIGQKVAISGGNGASSSAGVANGGDLTLDGGIGYGTGRSGYVLLNSIGGGNVGIGTSTPTSLLSVASSTANGTSRLFGIGTTTDIFTVLANGNVGISSANPSSLLSVAGTFGVTGTSTLATTTASLLSVTGALNASSTLAVTGQSTFFSTLNVVADILPTTTNARSLGTNALRFLNLFSRNIFATSSVITNATSTNFYADNINGGAGSLNSLGVNSINVGTISVSGTLAVSAGTSTFGTAGVQGVGVGSSTPGSKLSVRGSAGAINPIFTAASSSDAVFFTVLSNGNVGIGTSTPGFGLTTAGDAFIGSGRLYLNSTNGWINRTEAGNSFQISPSGNASVFDLTSGIAGFGANGSSNFTIQGGGVVGAQTTFTIKGQDHGGNTGTGTILALIGGAGSSATTGSAGGPITITGGQANGSAANAGGDVTINGGAATSTGTNGNVLLATLRGNVGIGTTTPGTKLIVQGTTTLVGTSVSPTALSVVGNIDNTATSTFTPVVTATLSGVGASPAVVGKYAYTVHGTTGVFNAVNISNPTAPVVVGSTTIGTLSSSFYTAASGRYVYVVSSASSTLTVLDVSNPASITTVATTSTGATNPNGIAISGRYAYITHGAGGDVVKVLDISNPTAPAIVGSLTLALRPAGIVVYGKYAYTANFAGNSMSVIDVSSPANPVLATTTPVQQVNPTTIVVSGQYAYIGGSNGSVMTIMDVSRPTSPVLTATTTVMNGTGGSLGISGRYLYMMGTFVSNFAVIDVANPASPIVVSSSTNVGLGGGLQIVGRYGYAGTSNNLKVIDLGGMESVSAIVHSLEAGNLSVRNDFSAAGNVTIGTGLMVGNGGFLSQGDGAVSGSFTVGTSTFPTFFADAANNRVNIGTSTGASTLFVQGTSTANPFTVASSTGTSLFTVLANGNVGIGTSTPGSGLFVQTRTGTNPFTIGATSTGSTLFGIDQTGKITLVSGATFDPVTAVGAGANDLTITSPDYLELNGSFNTDIQAGGVTKLQVGSSITFRADASPLVDASTNLGDLTHKFNLFANSIIASSTVLTGTTTLALNTGYVNIGTSTQSGNSKLTVQGTTTLVGTSVSPTALKVVGNFDNTATSTFKPFIVATTTTAANPLFSLAAGKYLYVGNAGGSLQIFDISSPTSPQLVSTTAGVGGGRGMAIAGKYAYLTGLSTTVKIVDISDPKVPVTMSTLTAGTSLGGIVVSGQYAYIADSTGGKLIIADVSNPTSPRVVATSSTTGGAYDVRVAGKYAYVSTDSSFQTFDISNPAVPVLKGTVAIGGVAGPHSTDVSGRYAYVANYTGGGKLNIIDISSSTAPTIVSTSSPTNGQNLTLYGRYALTSYDGIDVVDVGSSTAPTLISTVTGTGALAFSPTAVSGHYLYQAGYSNAVLTVIDMGGMESTSVIAHSLEAGNLAVRNDAFFQQSVTLGGGLTVGSLGFQSQGNSSVYGNFTIGTSTFPTFFADAGNNRVNIGTSTGASTLFVQGTSTANPFTVASSTGTSLFTVLANGNVGIGTSTPNATLVVQGTSSATTSLRVVGSIDNTAVSTFNPRVVSTSTTVANPLVMAGQGRYLYIGHQGGSLSIFDISNPATSTLISNTATVGGGRGMAVSGRYLYTTSVSTTVRAVDISNPTSPTTVSTIVAGTQMNGLAIAGRYLYAVDTSTTNLVVIDVSNPASMSIVSTVATIAGVNAVAVQGRYAYVYGTNTMNVIDISNPLVPTVVGTLGSLTASGGAGTVAVSGYLLYLAGSSLYVVDVSNPTTPVLKSTFAAGGGSNIQLSGRYLYTSHNNVAITDISSSTAPVAVGSLTGTGGTSASPVYVTGRYIYQGAYAAATLVVADIGSGIETTSGIINALEAGNLSVRNDTFLQGKLAVSGGINIGNGGFLSQGNSSVYGSFRVGTSTFPEFFVDSGNSRVNIGTSTGAATLFVQGTSTANPFTIASSTGSTLFTVLANGNVGIGTTTPASTLTVQGNVRTSNGSGFGVILDASGSGATNALQSRTTGLAVLNGASNAWAKITTLGVGIENTASLNWGTFGGESAIDTNLSRIAAGVVGVGTGAQGSVAGTLIAATIGVGTSTPGSKLDIYQNTSTSNVDIFRILTDVGSTGNVKFRIDSDGDIFTDGGTTIGTPADLAENYPAIEAVDAGTVVAFGTTTTAWDQVKEDGSSTESYQISGVRKATDGYEAIGIISTKAGITLGGNTTNGVPVAFTGRVPVKITSENGEVHRGDYLTVSKTRPGYAMKLTGEGKSIGVAVSDYQAGNDKLMALIQNGYQKLDATGKYATTTAMLTTGNVDLNANGVAIINIKSLASANGSWSIDADGRITAKVLCLEDVCIDKTQLTNILNSTGQISSPVGVVAGTSTTNGDTGSTTPEGGDTGTGTSTPADNGNGGATSTDPGPVAVEGDTPPATEGGSPSETQPEPPPVDPSVDPGV